MALSAEHECCSCVSFSSYVGVAVLFEQVIFHHRSKQTVQRLRRAWASQASLAARCIASSVTRFFSKQIDTSFGKCGNCIVRILTCSLGPLFLEMVG